MVDDSQKTQQGNVQRTCLWSTSSSFSTSVNSSSTLSSSSSNLDKSCHTNKSKKKTHTQNTKMQRLVMWFLLLRAMDPPSCVLVTVDIVLSLATSKSHQNRIRGPHHTILYCTIHTTPRTTELACVERCFYFDGCFLPNSQLSCAHALYPTMDWNPSRKKTLDITIFYRHFFFSSVGLCICVYPKTWRPFHGRRTKISK